MTPAAVEKAFGVELHQFRAQERGAEIIVYQAPNTDQGTVDAFAAAVFDNANR